MTMFRWVRLGESRLDSRTAYGGGVVLSFRLSYGVFIIYAHKSIGCSRLWPDSSLYVCRLTIRLS